jgi:hypothetical protein
VKEVRVRRRALIAVAVVVALLAGSAGTYRLLRKSGLLTPLTPPGGSHVINDALVGQTETEIRKAYGAPDRDWEGYEPLALHVPPVLPPGPIRTLIFRPQGGTLWVWVEEREEGWVCFESCWYVDGVHF